MTAQPWAPHTFALVGKAQLLLRCLPSASASPPSDCLRMRLRSAFRGRLMPCSMQHVRMVPLSRSGALHVMLL